MMSTVKLGTQLFSRCWLRYQNPLRCFINNPNVNRTGLRALLLSSMSESRNTDQSPEVFKTRSQLAKANKDDKIASIISQSIETSYDYPDIIKDVKPYVIESVLLHLVKGRCSETALKGFILHNVDLLKSHSGSTVCTGITRLVEQGFRGGDLLGVLSGLPNVVSYSESRLGSALDNWRTVGFSEGKLQDLVAKCPQLLTLKADFIQRRVNDLRELLCTSDVLRVIRSSPEVFFRPWDELETCFRYIYFMFPLKPGEIMKANILSHSLDHIRTRHMILLRSHLYQPPDKHGNTGGVKNPCLSHILDTDDKEFLKVAARGRLSLEELEVFKDMVEMEDFDSEVLYNFDESDLFET